MSVAEVIELTVHWRGDKVVFCILEQRTALRFALVSAEWEDEDGHVRDHFQGQVQVRHLHFLEGKQVGIDDEE